MNRRETYKYYVKAKLDKETDEYTLGVKIKGDPYESLIFAIEAVTRNLMVEGKITKKDFLKHIGKTYDIIKEDMKNDNN